MSEKFFLFRTIKVKCHNTRSPTVFLGLAVVVLNSDSRFDYPSGFLILVVSMIIITGAMFYLFIKKKWIKLGGNKVLPEKNEKELEK